MTALIDILQKEKSVISEIKQLASSRQRSYEAIEWYRANAFEDGGVGHFLITNRFEEIKKLDKEIDTHFLTLEAVRKEILEYFESIKEVDNAT